MPLIDALRACLKIVRYLLPASAMFTVLLFSSSAHAVGFQHLVVPDPDGAPLEVGIWYPSATTPTPSTIRTVTQMVALNAPVDGKSLPLILVSHGTGGSYLSHYDTAQALANAGFIVAAVTHTGDNYADMSRNFFILERARHISRMLDYLLSTWDGRSQIDATRIGMFGFSAGGFTTLVNLGGHSDMASIAPFCEIHTSDFACQLITGRSAAHVQTLPGREGGKDARIKAAVVAAPALGFAFTPEGLKEVTMPVQLWRAADDKILPHPWYAEAVRGALPRKPEYHVVENAGHFDFLAPCNEFLAQKAPEICSSAPGFNRSAFHAMFNQEIVRFFQASLPMQ